jgi:hypothetical protein
MKIHVLKAFATAVGSWSAGMRCEIPDDDAERYIRAGLVERDEPTVETPERGRIRLRKATKEGPIALD